jgi:hypothetical protein
VTPGTVADTPVDMSLRRSSRARAEVAAASPVTTALATGWAQAIFDRAAANGGLAPAASIGGRSTLDRSALDADPGIEVTSTFDVPAFLRRQES